jgi:hypothetical protein
VDHRQYHVVAGCAAFVAALTIGIAARAKLLDPGAPADDKAIDMDLTAVEVSVARPQKKITQPQKQHRDPVHKQQAQGLAHDDKKPPPDQKKKPDDKPKQTPDDDKDGPTAKITDDTAPAGKITEEQGSFNPNKFGIDDVDKGDEYLKGVKEGLIEAGGTFPTILEATGQPLACVHIDQDGKVIDTLFKQKSGDGDVDNWVERALKEYEKAANKDPKPVPENSRKYTYGWICFHFNLAKQP